MTVLYNQKLEVRNSSTHSNVVAAGWQINCEIGQLCTNLDFIKQYNQKTISCHVICLFIN